MAHLANAMVTIDVDTSAAMQTLDEWPQIEQEFVRAGAKGAFDFLRDYHSKMTWRGGRWIPGANSGQFAENVVKGWQQPVVQGLNVTITNTFGLLSWKVTGGTITPKSAGALTIPLVPQAKGVPARSIPGLFIAGNALVRRPTTITLAFGGGGWRQVGKQLEAIYALSRGVTQAPWPNALPPDEAVATAFADGGNLILAKWGQ